MRRFYLISYDIIHDKRRNQIYKTLLDYGDRVQYSVFCCQLNRRELLALKQKLKSIIHHKEDQILFVDTGPVHSSKPQPKITYIGKAYSPEPRIQIV